MSFARVASAVIAVSSIVIAGRARAACSVTAFATVGTDLRAAAAPPCGPAALQRVFARASRKAAAVTRRMAKRCGRGRSVRIFPARKQLLKVRAMMHGRRMAAQMHPGCVAAYEAALEQLDAELVAAETGIPATTTTTSVPTGPTTTTQPIPCTTVTLEVDVGDCLRVTSVPRGRVDCDQNCDTGDFTVPASKPLQLRGVPDAGDTSVSFDGDCDEDGTVLLGTATFPDCMLDCDCSSEFN